MKHLTKAIIFFISLFLFILSVNRLKAVDHLSFTLSSVENVLPFTAAWISAVLSSLILVLLPYAVISLFKIMNVKAFAVLSAAVSLLVSAWLWWNFLHIMNMSEMAIFGHMIEDPGSLHAVSAVLHVLYAAIITGISFLFFYPVQVCIGDKAGGQRKKRQ